MKPYLSTYKLPAPSLLLVVTGLFFCLPLMAQTGGNGSTIDQSLQRLALRLLNGKQGSIVCITPRTGAVRCLASRTEVGDSINRAISMAYSPGSTFKVPQALVQLSVKSLSPERSYGCSKGFWYRNVHIGCHSHRQPLTLVDALAQSCNAYFCKSFIHFVREHQGFPSRHVAMDAWRLLMQSMGLGRRTGIDLPGEATGRMPGGVMLDSIHNTRWNEATIMWMGMGQGEVTATPLQLANIAALTANQGWWVTPHVSVWDSAMVAANVHKARIAPEAWPIVVEGMKGAVLKGTAKAIRHCGFNIAGKTGTAENHADDHSIFICFAPYEKPEIAVAVYIEHGGFGADMAAPLAALMVEQALTGRLTAHSEHKVEQWEDYYVVPPVEPEPAVALPDTTAQPAPKQPLSQPKAR